MSRKSKKLWQLVMLLAVDLALLILISSLVTADAFTMHTGFGGERVAAVQKSLCKQGFFDGEADGNFCLKTRSAIREFQKTKGLDVNGYADFETVRSLGIGTSESPCFSINAELLALCIQQSGCRNYPEMLFRGIEIIAQSKKTGTFGNYSRVTPDPEETDKISSHAYAAALAAMRLCAEQTDCFF